MYIAVFGILLGAGTATFFFCWDHTRAVIFTADQVESALRAGETWRADIRAATGKIAAKTTTEGETVTIPQKRSVIIYRFHNREIHREVGPTGQSRILLSQVKASEIQAVARAGVPAWRWELELNPRREETHFPLLFTFEAAQAKP